MPFYHYQFNSQGQLFAKVVSAKESLEVPDGVKVITREEELPETASFYDAESNSILHMKEVEDNGETFLIIDHDKEPIFL